MEQTAVQSMQYLSITNPKVKITLEFTGEADNATVEKEITSVLMERYLKNVLKGSVQSETQALITSPLKREGGKTNE